MKKSSTVLRYVAPGTRRQVPVRVSRRELEFVHALRERGPASRVDLLKHYNFRVGLNAPALASQLRAKGVAVSTEWTTADDLDGVPCRFVRYALRGKVLGVTA